MMSSLWTKVKEVAAAEAAFFIIIGVTFLTGRGYGKRIAEQKRAELDNKSLTDELNTIHIERKKVHDAEVKIDGESRADLDKHDDKWMRD